MRGRHGKGTESVALGQTVGRCARISASASITEAPSEEAWRHPHHEITMGIHMPHFSPYQIARRPKSPTTSRYMKAGRDFPYGAWPPTLCPPPSLPGPDPFSSISTNVAERPSFQLPSSASFTDKISAEFFQTSAASCGRSKRSALHTATLARRRPRCRCATCLPS